MSLAFNVISKVNPLSPQEGDCRYYAVLRSFGLVDAKEVGRQLSRVTDLTSWEAEFVVHQLGEVLVQNLLRGHTVKLADMGSFSLTINSVGCQSPEEVTADCIKNVKINFRPTETTKQLLNCAVFCSCAD